MKKNNLRIIPFFLIFLVAFTTVYSNDRIVFELADKLDAALWPHKRVFGKIRHAIARTADELNPFYSTKPILSRLKVYDFTLSPKDLRYFYSFDREKYKADMNEKPGVDFRKVELKTDRGSAAVKMKLHGDGARHWLGKKKSFQIKAEAENPFGRKGRWVFISPDLRNYLMPVFAARVARDMGIPAVDSDFVAVRFNGRLNGVYFMEEYVNQALIDTKKIPGVLIRIGDNWIDDRKEAGGDPLRYFGGITFNDHHDTPFNLEPGNLRPIAHPGREAALRKTEELFSAIRDGDVGAFESLVDAENFGAADAWRTLFGDRHTLLGDNIRLIYRPEDGKFMLMIRTEGEVRSLEYQGGSFEVWANMKTRIVPLWSMMTRSPEVRQRRNLRIQKLLSQEAGILGDFDALRARYEPLLARDANMSEASRELRRTLDLFREKVAGNFSRLREQFDYHKVYVHAAVDGNAIEMTITPDTSLQNLVLKALRFSFLDAAPAKAENVSLHVFDETKRAYELKSRQPMSPKGDLSALFSGIELGYAFEEDFRTKPVRRRFRIVFEDRKNLPADKVASIVFKAALSGEDLPPDDTYVSFGKAVAPAAMKGSAQ